MNEVLSLFRSFLRLCVWFIRQFIRNIPIVNFHRDAEVRIILWVEFGLKKDSEHVIIISDQITGDFVTSATPRRPHPRSATSGFERTTLSPSHAEYLFHLAVTDSTKVTATQWGLLLNNSWLVTREHPSQLCGLSTCEMTTQHLRAPSAQWSRLSPMNPCNLGLRVLHYARSFYIIISDQITGDFVTSATPILTDTDLKQISSTAETTNN